MTDAVLVAVVSGAFTLIGSCAGVLRANKLTNYRIEQLEDKVDKFGELTERVVVVEQSAKSAHKRIGDMERGIL
ncbi:MAG: hypothetical protein RSJ41_06130 [Clostridia bacterium]